MFQLYKLACASGSIKLFASSQGALRKICVKGTLSQVNISVRVGQLNEAAECNEEEQLLRATRHVNKFMHLLASGAH